MLKISFVNMPFAAVELPSIGLTQIKGVIDRKFGDKVTTSLHYLNQEFAKYLGLDFYKSITGSLEHHNSGIGEWFFRQAAFPELADNTEEYFRRYYPHRNEVSQRLRDLLHEKRKGLDEFLDSLIEKHSLDRADIVGLTSMFSQNVSSFAMARKLKARNPNLITAMGGANCESPMAQEIVKQVKYIDYAFSGPALKSFPDFVQNCLDNDTEKSSSIKGILSKPKLDKSRTLPMLNESSHPQTMGEELDINVTVHLDYDEFLDVLELNFPKKQVDPILLFETSRGCWWGEKAHCTFCGLNGQTMNYRAMSRDNALEQFEAIFKYSSRCSRLSCVDNILPKSYLTDVLPFLNTPANMSIFYEVKADLSEEDVQVLANARVKTIQPGVESLATSTLKLMKKGTSVFQNLFLLKNCVMYDVEPEWNLLIGFPGEGADTYKKYVRDLHLLTHLPPPHGVFPVRFDRYSPYYVQAKQYELDLHPVDFYELTYPFDKESLANLAYYFMDHNLNAKYFLTMAKWIGKIKEQYNPWWNRWHGKDELSPPALFFKPAGASRVVHDSRTGEVIEHRVSEAGLRVLDYLDKPRKLSDITAGLSQTPGFDSEVELASLQHRGLVFQEGERFVSLVFPRRPPNLTMHE